MTNNEILKKALLKANIDVNILSNTDPYSIIFSHDFAKSFFGEKTVCNKCDVSNIPPNLIKEEVLGCYNCEFYNSNGWQYYLQQMVLQEDAVKYLEQFLN